MQIDATPQLNMDSAPPEANDGGGNREKERKEKRNVGWGPSAHTHAISMRFNQGLRAFVQMSAIFFLPLRVCALV